MKRRDFIKGASIFVSTAYLASCASGVKGRTPNQKRLAFFSIANSRERHPQGHLLGGTTSVHILNIESSELKEHPLPIKFPHSLIQHPQMKNIVAITPRDQSLAVALNIETGATLKLISLENEQKFYGHGFFSADGDRLFLTGYDKNSKGFLKEYDLNWNELGHVETFGRAPHDVKTIQGGKIALVANNGWPGHSSYSERNLSSLVYLDMKSRKLIEKVELPLGYLGFQHFETNDRGDFVVGCDYYGNSKNGENYKSLLAYRKMTEPLNFLSISAEMKAHLHGNILSIAWDQQKQSVVTTTPEGPVTIWDLAGMQAVRQELNKHFPHGVALSASDIYVTTSSSGVWTAKKNNLFSSGAFSKMNIPPIQNISAHSAWID